MFESWNVYQRKKLRLIFHKNAYPTWFFDRVVKKFEKSCDSLNNISFQSKNNQNQNFYNFGIPYYGKSSQSFAKRFATLIKSKFNVELKVYYTTVKTHHYFQLKCATPSALLSNVVYKITCLCDTSISYIGMTSRHLATRAKEHMHSTLTTKSAVRDHINSCSSCQQRHVTVKDFVVLKQCQSEYETKIQEALLIKKFNPKLNTQLYASGSSFLLNVY